MPEASRQCRQAVEGFAEIAGQLWRGAATRDDALSRWTAIAAHLSAAPAASPPAALQSPCGEQSATTGGAQSSSLIDSNGVTAGVVACAQPGVGSPGSSSTAGASIGSAAAASGAADVAAVVTALYHLLEISPAGDSANGSPAARPAFGAAVVSDIHQQPGSADCGGSQRLHELRGLRCHGQPRAQHSPAGDWPMAPPGGPGGPLRGTSPVAGAAARGNRHSSPSPPAHRPPNGEGGFRRGSRGFATGGSGGPVAVACGAGPAELQAGAAGGAPVAPSQPSLKGGLEADECQGFLLE